MKTIRLFAIAGAAFALDGAASVGAESTPALGVRSLSETMVHENVLRYHPPEWIVNSTTLSGYLEANHGTSSQTNCL